MATRSPLLSRLRRERLAEPEVYDVLQNDRRRRVLRCLCDHGGELTLRELASLLAAEESDGETDELERSIYNSLHQTHLPKLESTGVVSYDRHSNTVTLEPSAGDLERYLALRSVFGLTWGEYYRMLATGCLLLALAADLEFGPLAGVDTVAVLTVSLGVLTGSMLYQAWRRRWIHVKSLVG